MTGTVGAAVNRVADSSGRGRTATAAGSVTYAAGPAVHLDGSTGYLTTDSAVLDTRASFTVCAWVRLDRVPATFATAVSQDGGSDSAFWLQYSAAYGGFAFADLSAGPPVVDQRAVRAGVWYQLTGVHDAAAGTISLYVNGSAIASQPMQGPVASTGPLRIGRARSHDGPADWWPGSVGRVEAYARALGSGEIGQLYQAGR